MMSRPATLSGLCFQPLWLAIRRVLPTGWMQNCQLLVILRIQLTLVCDPRKGVESIFLQPVEVSWAGEGMNNIFQVLPL